MGCSQSCAASAAGKSRNGNRFTAQHGFATRQPTTLTSGQLCDALHCTAHVHTSSAETPLKLGTMTTVQEYNCLETVATLV
jgi:hypothetical protein